MLQKIQKTEDKLQEKTLYRKRFRRSARNFPEENGDFTPHYTKVNSGAEKGEVSRRDPLDGGGFRRGRDLGQELMCGVYRSTKNGVSMTSKFTRCNNSRTLKGTSS